jgi:hypothetical protein
VRSRAARRRRPARDLLEGDPDARELPLPPRRLLLPRARVGVDADVDAVVMPTSQRPRWPRRGSKRSRRWFLRLNPQMETRSAVVGVVAVGVVADVVVRSAKQAARPNPPLHRAARITNSR